MVLLCLILLCLGGLGCGATPARPVPHYPSLKSASSTPSTFTKAEAATRLTLPCAPGEPEADNGLDDDCDGTVDKGLHTRDLALVVTLAHPALIDVTLSMKQGATAPIQPKVERAKTCDMTAPFSLQSLALGKLETGRYELTLTRSAACGGDPVAAAVVNASIWLHGELSGTYAVKVAPGTPSVLGVIDVP